MTILVCHSDGLYACISIAGKCTVLWQHSLELGGLLTHCFPHMGSFWDEVFCNVLRYPCADVCLTCVRGAYCWSCARVDINKSDFIMLLTGCDYMFRSLLLSMTVNVLASTAKDDVKIKKRVCKPFLLLSLLASRPPSSRTPPQHSTYSSFL